MQRWHQEWSQGLLPKHELQAASKHSNRFYVLTMCIQEWDDCNYCNWLFCSLFFCLIIHCITCKCCTSEILRIRWFETYIHPIDPETHWTVKPLQRSWNLLISLTFFCFLLGLRWSWSTCSFRSHLLPLLSAKGSDVDWGCWKPNGSYLLDPLEIPPSLSPQSFHSTNWKCMKQLLNSVCHRLPFALWPAKPS